MMDQQEEIFKKLLYPLVDALNMDMRYGSGEGALIGKKVIQLRLFEQQNLCITATVVDSFIDEAEKYAGVIAHLGQHLYMAAISERCYNNLMVLVLDGRPLGWKNPDRVKVLQPYNKNWSRKDFIGKVVDGVKAFYVRDFEAETWEEHRGSEKLRSYLEQREKGLVDFSSMLRETHGKIIDVEDMGVQQEH